MRIGRSEPHTLAGAYAMHAVSGRDKARFERHLARCEGCAQEIDSLREATARLAAATAVPPPPALKQQTLAAAAQTRQLPPLTPRPSPRARPVIGWRIAQTTGLPHAAGRFRGRWVKGVAVAIGGALVIVSAVLGVDAHTTQHRLTQAQLDDHQIAAVLTARDATMLTAPVENGGTATVVMSLRERALVFTATGLGTPPPARSYELWLLEPSGNHPAGMLPPATRDVTGPVIASGLKPGDHLGLTMEAAHGSGHPTSPMLLELAL